MHAPPVFTFEFEAATVEQLATFALELVVDAAWLRYQAQLDVEKVAGHERGVDLVLDRDERRLCVQAAFDAAIDKLSADNPFREALRRYVVEVALQLVSEETPPPRPTLKLVP